MNIYTQATLLSFFCSIIFQISGYEYSFFNHTAEPIVIGIQFIENGKNTIYKQLVKPNEQDHFIPGERDVSSLKSRFCLKTIYYAKNPTEDQKAHNFEKTILKEIPITWISKKNIRLTKNKAKTGHKSLIPIRKAPIRKDTSLCKNRHFDIIQDQAGVIHITSLTYN